MTSIKSTRHIQIARFLLAALCLLYVFAFPTLTASAASGTINFEELCELSAYTSMYEGQIETPGNWKPFNWSANREEAESGIVTQSDLPEWDTIQSIANMECQQDQHPTAYKMKNLASRVISTFNSAPAYNGAISTLKSMEWSYNLSFGFTATGSTVQTTLDSKIREFNASAASNSAEGAFGSIYDMSNFNPQAGEAQGFLNGVFKVINVIFYVAANLMIWFFLLQTTFDVLYLMFEWIRPFISSGRGGGAIAMGNNGNGGSLSKFHIPICSEAAVEACNGHGNGGFGNNGGGSKSNFMITYLVKRVPVILCCTCYIILVSMGYWTKLISWITGFVVQLISGIMTIGQ